MKKAKKGKTPAPVQTLLLFGAAVLLLLGSAVGGARGALTYFSETYASQMQMYDIGVTLQENGEPVSWRNYDTRTRSGDWAEETGTLLEHMLGQGERLKLGQVYPETLSVKNTGTINQYVRVNLYKYWVDADGKKMQELSPDLIDLKLVNLDQDWIVDESASTPERTVLYYNKLLYAEGEGKSETSLFADGLRIDDALAAKTEQKTETKDGKTVVTTTYLYNGVKFCLEARVDAVQEHNAQDAIRSAWGRKVTVKDGSLRLK